MEKKKMNTWLWKNQYDKLTTKRFLLETNPEGIRTWFNFRWKNPAGG